MLTELPKAMKSRTLDVDPNLIVFLTLNPLPSEVDETIEQPRFAGPEILTRPAIDTPLDRREK
jgi:hypothetical protein